MLPVLMQARIGEGLREECYSSGLNTIDNTARW